jgi:hypothetical protein
MRKMKRFEQDMAREGTIVRNDNGKFVLYDDMQAREKVLVDALRDAVALSSYGRDVLNQIESENSRQEGKRK